MEKKKINDSKKMNSEYNFGEAQKEFLNIIKKLKDSDSIIQLTSWISKNWNSGMHTYKLNRVIIKTLHITCKSIYTKNTLMLTFLWLFEAFSYIFISQ